jgi:hypothetical protein
VSSEKTEIGHSSFLPVLVQLKHEKLLQSSLQGARSFGIFIAGRQVITHPTPLRGRAETSQVDIAACQRRIHVPVGGMLIDRKGIVASRHDGGDLLLFQNKALYRNGDP